MTPAMLTAIGGTISRLITSSVRVAPDGRGFLVDIDTDLPTRFYPNVDTTLPVWSFE